MNIAGFLLDENVAPVLGRILQQQAPTLDVGRVGDPGKPAFGTEDLEILLWCEANGCALVTNDRASMPLHLRDLIVAGHHVPGIFVLPREMSFRAIVNELMLVWGASDSEEYRDRLIYVRARS